jgi:hypothetical protein
MSVIFFYDAKDQVPFFYLAPSRWSGEVPPPYDSSLLPRHYLEFAIRDLDDQTPRGLVNAFSNIKRALHFLIDSLLHQYGAFIHYKRANFPVKLRLLDTMGILPITLMKNLNVERNLLEHEYAVPSQRRVEEAVDVAKLILMATERIIERIPTEVVAGWRNPKRHVVLQLEPLAGSIRVFGLRAKGKYHKSKGGSCFRGPLRSFFGDELSEGVALTKKPWREISVRRETENEWTPIVRELVNIQRREREKGSVLNTETATITVPVTIPLPDIPQQTWAELLDKLLAQKRAKGEKEADAKSLKRDNSQTNAAARSKESPTKASSVRGKPRHCC